MSEAVEKYAEEYAEQAMNLLGVNIAIGRYYKKDYKDIKYEDNQSF